MTPRRQAVLDYIRSYIGKHGYAPTNAEIRKRFGFRSPSTVHSFLTALEAEGCIQRIPNVTRGIRLPEAPERDNPQGVQVPLVGVIAAGTPIEAILNYETIEVPKGLLGKGQTIALRVRGDSMVDENIRDGDVVLVDVSRQPLSGEVGVALIDHSEATLKKIYYESDHVRLEPANPNYAPIIVAPPERLVTQGVVTGLLRKY